MKLLLRLGAAEYYKKRFKRSAYTGESSGLELRLPGTQPEKYPAAFRSTGYTAEQVKAESECVEIEDLTIRQQFRSTGLPISELLEAVEVLSQVQTSCLNTSAETAAKAVA